MDMTDLILEARNAFWNKLAELIPETNVDPIGPDDVVLFDSVTETVARSWVRRNVPKPPTFDEFVREKTITRSEDWFDLKRCTYVYKNAGSIEDHGPRYSLKLGVAMYRSDDLRELELKLYEHAFRGAR